MLSLDLSILYQIIGFFVLLFILNRFLFRPLLKVMEERDRQTTGTLKKAEDIEKEVSEGKVAYEKRLQEARIKGSEARQVIKQEALEEEKRLLEEAGKEASLEISFMREKIAGEKEAAMKELTEETKSMSRNIASRLLERKLAIVLLAGFLTSLPLIANAAEHAEEGWHGLGLWKVINFLLLVVGLYFVWKKVLCVALDKRQADIKKAISEAARVKEEAEKAAVQYREQLANLESRLASITEELRLEGEEEKRRIIEEAKKAAERIKEQAKVSAGQEVKKAQIEIRAEVAELAVRLARDIIKGELKPEDQQRLIKDYISNLRLN